MESVEASAFDEGKILLEEVNSGLGTGRHDSCRPWHKFQNVARHTCPGLPEMLLFGGGNGQMLTSGCLPLNLFRVT